MDRRVFSVEHRARLSVARKRQTLPIEHIWSQLNREGPVPAHCPELGPCWVWTGRSVHKFGYGLWNNEPVHRIAWRLTYGPIPEGLSVLHRCDKPPCARPDHLFLGTQADNMRDMVQKGRHVGDIKLSQEQVSAIRDRYSIGDVLQRELATEFCVSAATISLLVNRKVRL